MEQVFLKKDYFSKNNRPFFVIGINYMPRKAFYRMWDDWDPAQIEKDFITMKELKISVVRVPILWNSIEPKEGIISKTFLERFDEFLRIAEKHDIYVFPFFFVGVCVDKFDIPWRQGRSVYANPDMLKNESELVKAVASKYADNPVILAWDVSDEPYWAWGFTDAETATKWVSLLYKTINSNDKNHPVTIGFDNGHIVNDTGFQVERLVPFQDFFSVCAYPIYSLKVSEAHTSTRSTYFTSFFVKFSNVGKPVFLTEGPGTTTVWTSPERMGSYYRVVLYSSFVNGSIGVMPWILYDYDLCNHSGWVLDHKPYETSFGILTSSGEMKPAAKELRRFAEIIHGIDLDKFHFRKPEAALIIPADYYKHVKTSWPRLFEAFILAKEAHLELTFLREGEDFSNYKLIIIPSSLTLRTGSWHKLKRYIDQGGNVYFSYGGSCVGSPNPLGPIFSDVFGVSLKDIIAPMPKEEVFFTQNWMGSKLDKLEYPRTDGVSTIELEVEKRKCIAYNSRNDPVMFVNRNKGKGTSILVSHALEYYLSLIPDAHLYDQTFRIYNAIKKEAKITSPYICDNPHIEIGWLETEDKKEGIMVLINHERVSFDSTISLKAMWQVEPVLGDSAVSIKKRVNRTWIRSSFDPSEVKIFQLKR